jgi:hypothetical protein
LGVVSQVTRDEVSPEVIQIIEDMNKYDTLLYQYVKEVLHKQSVQRIDNFNQARIALHKERFREKWGDNVLTMTYEEPPSTIVYEHGRRG